MPAKRGAMRKIREVVQLKFEAKLGHERIAAATGVSKGAVANYVRRALQQGLVWPPPEDLEDGALERLLFGQVSPVPGRPSSAAPASPSADVSRTRLLKKFARIRRKKN